LKILYVTAKGGIHDYRFLKMLVRDYRVLLLHYAADELIDEIKSIRGLEIISKKPWPVKSYPYLSEKSHFKKIYDEFRPDIIHTGYVWQVGVLPAFYNLRPHLSMVWGSDVLTEPDRSSYKKKLVDMVMNQSDHIQCDAEVVKKKIISDYDIAPEKITVFPWGIELDVFKKLNKSDCRKYLGLSPNDFIVVFTRHLEPVYGVNYLLEGFKKFAKNKKDVMLVMLSSGSLLNETRSFISEYPLDSKIRLIRSVPNTELPRFLNAADVYISTSLSDGTSLSLLEAMASGLGLVVTGLPAINEWVNEENGFTVPPLNVDQVASSLEKYYADRKLVELHGNQNILIAKERADWNKNYLKLKEIYENLLRIY